VKPPRTIPVSTVVGRPLSRRRPVRMAWLIAVLGIVLTREVCAEQYALLIGIDQYLNQSSRVPPTERRRQRCEEHAADAEPRVRIPGGKHRHVDRCPGDVSRCPPRVHTSAGRSSRPDDTFVFYFAGHGTQLPDDDGDEQLDDPDDALDEALCMYDFTELGDNALRDDELGRLLDRLAAGQVVVILDCCHSGTATRDITTVGSARYWPMSLPVERVHTPTGIRGSVSPDLQRAPARPAARGLLRLLGDSESEGVGSSVPRVRVFDRLVHPLSGTGVARCCRYQRRRAGHVRRGASVCGAADRRNHNRAQEIERLRQTPMLETDSIATRDLPVFAVATKQPMHANASSAGPDTVQLDLGAVHGLMPDTRWGLFRDLNDVDAKRIRRCGEIRVTSVGAETSQAVVLNAPGDGNRWIAAPLVNPLTSPAAFLWTERRAVDGKVPKDMAGLLLQELNARLAQQPQVRIDARSHWDLHVILDQRASEFNAIEIEVRCVERNGREHPALRFRAPLPFLQPDRTRRCDEILSWLEPQIEAVRARQTLAGLTNPSPGFGLQAVVDRRPREGQTLAEYQQGDRLVFGLKSTADCWYYIVAIDPQGKPQLWCPQPGQHHQAPADTKLLHPGPGETLILDGPPGVYTVKLLAVRNPLPRGLFPPVCRGPKSSARCPPINGPNPQ
jgi:hypothetical protein